MNANTMNNKDCKYTKKKFDEDIDKQTLFHLHFSKQEEAIIASHLSKPCIQH